MSVLAAATGLILISVGMLELRRGFRGCDLEAASAGAVLLVGGGVAIGVVIAGFFA